MRDHVWVKQGEIFAMLKVAFYVLNFSLDNKDNKNMYFALCMINMVPGNIIKHCQKVINPCLNKGDGCNTPLRFFPVRSKKLKKVI